MKAVLISIQPKWVEKIASGEKTIEVRKSVPKLERPFKVYIYATWNGSKKEILVKQDGLLYCEDWRKANGLQRASGKVVGEFVCDRIDELHEWELNPSNRFYEKEEKRLDLFLKESCLSHKEICDYRENLPYCKPLYGWHISNLKIYDKPKELYEFYPTKPKPSNKWTDNDYCQQCKYHKWIGSMQKYVETGEPMREKCTLGKPEPICEYTPPISRPPQSWCYVEELQNG